MDGRAAARLAGPHDLHHPYRGALSDVQIEIRTAAAWRSANRSPLLKAMVDVLPVVAADETSRTA